MFWTRTMALGLLWGPNSGCLENQRIVIAVKDLLWNGFGTSFLDRCLVWGRPSENHYFCFRRECPNKFQIIAKPWSTNPKSVWIDSHVTHCFLGCVKGPCKWPWEVHAMTPTRPPPPSMNFGPLLLRKRNKNICFCIFQKTSTLTPHTPSCSLVVFLSVTAQTPVDADGF